MSSYDAKLAAIAISLGLLGILAYKHTILQSQMKHTQRAMTSMQQQMSENIQIINEQNDYIASRPQQKHISVPSRSANVIPTDAPTTGNFKTGKSVDVMFDKLNKPAASGTHTMFEAKDLRSDNRIKPSTVDDQQEFLPYVNEVEIDDGTRERIERMQNLYNEKGAN